MYDNVFLFIKLVDFASYSNLARAVKIPQPSISRKIQQLEEHLQVRLLHRDNRNFSLTNAGEDLYNRFKASEQALAQDLESVWLLQPQNLEGTLRVALAPSLAEELVVPKLARFNARYPKVVLQISMLASSFDLTVKNFDLALGVRPLAASDFVKVQILRKFCLKFYASANYALQHKIPVQPLDLERHQLIGGAIVKQKSSFVMHNLTTGHEETVYLHSCINHDSVYQSLNIAKGGEFIFSALDFVMQSRIQDGSFIEILPEYILKEIPCYLTQNTATQNLLTNEFAKFLTQCISEGISK